MNLLEYAYHLDPHLFSTSNQLSSDIDPDFFSLIYSRTVAATDLTFMVEVSTNLITWSEVAPITTLLDQDEVTYRLRARIPLAGRTNLNLRLRVIRD